MSEARLHAQQPEWERLMRDLDTIKGHLRQAMLDVARAAVEQPDQVDEIIKRCTEWWSSAMLGAVSVALLMGDDNAALLEAKPVGGQQ